jgi:hypothetical protein
LPSQRNANNGPAWHNNFVGTTYAQFMNIDYTFQGSTPQTLASNHQVDYYGGYSLATAHSASTSTSLPPARMMNSFNLPLPSLESSFPYCLPSLTPAPTTPQLATPANFLPVLAPEVDVDIIQCQWNFCGEYIPRSGLEEHLTLVHPGEVVANRACRWGNCHSAGGEPQAKLVRHVKSHSVRVECAWCGDQFARDDAMKRHQKTGTCKRCTSCRVKFSSVQEKFYHMQSGTCTHKDRTVGRVKTVSKHARVLSKPY